jgi:phosphate uptake regulator
MKRKLIKQAGQACTITLPINWIRTHSLKAGDEIDLEIKNKQIVLSTQKKTATGKTKLNTKGFPFRLEKIYVNAAYAKGIDELELETSLKQVDFNQNLGYAVVSQRGSNVLIKDISGMTSGNLDEIFKRVFQLILGFYDNAIDHITHNKKSSIETINTIDTEINKFVFFLERSIIKLASMEEDEGKIMFAYSFALETIGDEILRLWRVNILTNAKTSKKLVTILELSKNGLEKAFEIYYQTDHKRILELMEIKQNIRKESMHMLKMDAPTAAMIMYAVKIVEQAHDLTHLAVMRRIHPD